MTKALFNIAALAVAATATLHVKSASGEPLYDADGKPIQIVLHSPGTRPYATIESRQTQRAVKRMNENEGKLTAATAEERLADTADDLAAITVAFENFTYGDGSLKGEELYRAVYADPALGFITRQVTKFIGDWGNFKPASSAG